ncbi:nucleotidyltransferase domain-containing protein [Mycobacteroides sp. PCS013]|uniref:phosphorylase family protein n=1 Tax=Mycobacteroides sp. PCS013 TaxID=3074106 RepID=UPI003C2EAACD
MSLSLPSGRRVPQRSISLRETLLQLLNQLGVSADVYLFGSRRYKTGSVRSDIDLLLVAPRGLGSEDLEAIRYLEPYLDVFEVIGGVARGLVNDSRINAIDFEQLVSMVDAVQLLSGGEWQDSANEYEVQTVLAERTPAATAIQVYDHLDPIFTERADVLVVTALAEEFEAIRAQLGSTYATVDSDKFARPERAVMFDAEGFLVRVINFNEMGSVGAALKTRNALVRTKAIHVVLVGICGGIPGKVELGDVVIPEKILYFEPRKILDDGEGLADDYRRCDDTAREAAALLTDSVLKGNGLVLHAGDYVMASGEKVVASQAFRDEIATRHRKIAAIDMESYGVARAVGEVGRRLTVIKSVCDMADGAKNDDFHAIASRNAASMLVTLLASNVFSS